MAANNTSVTSAVLTADDPIALYARNMEAERKKEYVTTTGSVTVDALIGGKPATVQINGEIGYSTRNQVKEKAVYFSPRTLTIGGKKVDIDTDIPPRNGYKIADIDISHLTRANSFADISQNAKGATWPPKMREVLEEAIEKAGAVQAQQSQPLPAQPRVQLFPAQSRVELFPAQPIKNPPMQKPAPTTEALGIVKQSLEFQKRMAASLKENNYFLGEKGTVESGTIAMLTQKLDGKDGIEVRSVKTGKITYDNKTGYDYSLINGSQEWTIREAFEKTGQSRGDIRLSLANARNPEQILVLDMPKEYVNPQYIKENIAKFQADVVSQKYDAGKAASFDLPKDRPVAYLTFSGFSEDDRTKTFKKSMARSTVMPDMLNQAGYNIVTDKNSWDAELLGANPREQIEARIAELRGKGVKDFVLDIQAHGTVRDITVEYKDKSGSERVIYMPSKDWQDIVKKFPDCNFTYDFKPCHGGGLIEAMQELVDAPDAKPGRVVGISHTKERLTNVDFGYEDLRMIFLQDMIDKKPGAAKTFGEIHLRADEEIRLQTKGRLDPEFYQSQPGRKSLRTAQTEMPATDFVLASGQNFTPQEGLPSLPSSGPARNV